MPSSEVMHLGILAGMGFWIWPRGLFIGRSFSTIIVFHAESRASSINLLHSPSPSQKKVKASPPDKLVPQSQFDPSSFSSTTFSSSVSSSFSIPSPKLRFHLYRFHCVHVSTFSSKGGHTLADTSRLISSPDHSAWMDRSFFVYNQYQNTSPRKFGQMFLLGWGVFGMSPFSLESLARYTSRP